MSQLPHFRWKDVSSLRCRRFDSRSKILSGYILACFLNPACDVFKVTRGVWLRIDSCLKTRHFIQNKERSLNKKGWHLKNTAEDLIYTPNTTYNVQVLRNAYIVLLILPISKLQ